MIHFQGRMINVCSVVSDCDTMDCSPPGSSVQGISQARILEWVAISSFRASSQPRDRTFVTFALNMWSLSQAFGLRCLMKAEDPAAQENLLTQFPKESKTHRHQGGTPYMKM